MINYKSFKWCLGIALSLGLSACNIDMQRPEPVNTSYQGPTKTTVHQTASNKPKLEQKTYASKDPTQKATPGPVRKAAPQLPVIQ